MSQLNRISFEALYGTTGTTFPDNTTGQISEGDLRAFGKDTSDSFLNGRDDVNTKTFSPVQATGTNTYAGSPPFAITAYTNLMRLYVKIPNTSTGASTLNVSAVGAKKIFINPSTQADAGHLRAGQTYIFVYDTSLDSSAGGWLILGSVPTSPGGSTRQLQYNSDGAFGGIANGNTGQIMTSNGTGIPPSFQDLPGTQFNFVYDDHLHYNANGFYQDTVGNPSSVNSPYWFSFTENSGTVEGQARPLRLSMFNLDLQLICENATDAAGVKFWQYMNVLDTDYADLLFDFYIDNANDGSSEITYTYMGLSYDESTNPIAGSGIGAFVYLSADGDLKFYSYTGSGSPIDQLLISDFTTGSHIVELLYTAGTLIVYVDGDDLYSVSSVTPGYLSGGIPVFGSINTAGTGKTQMVDRIRIRTSR